MGVSGDTIQFRQNLRACYSHADLMRELLPDAMLELYYIILVSQLMLSKRPTQLDAEEGSSS